MVIKNYRWDGGAWRVYKWIDGKCHYFGRYEDETQAIKKVNRLRKNKEFNYRIYFISCLC